MAFLSYDFLLDASIFTTVYEKNLCGTKMNSSNIFERYYWAKKIEILKHSWQFNTVDNLNIQKIELLKIKLSHELPSKLNYILSKTYKKSHSTIQTIIALNKFVFHPYNCLFPLWIWVTESQLQQLPFLFIS